MKKKYLAILGAILIGILMLSATAYAAISGTSGYDAYKAALKNTIAAKSITANVQVSVKDNGSTLMSATSTVKENRDAQAMSSITTVNAGGQQKTMETYEQAGQRISKSSDSDTYNVFTGRGEKFRKEPKNPDLNSTRSKDMENVVDALVGNLQNYINLNTNSDGTQSVTFQLSGSQVPPVANAVTSLLVKNMDRENKGFGGRREGMKPFDNSMIDNLPKLVSDIKVDNVNTNATINKDNIQKQTIDITISGKDADGKYHQLVVSVVVDLTNINSTAADTVNLNGKKVNNVVNDFAGRYGHRKDKEMAE